MGGRVKGESAAIDYYVQRIVFGTDHDRLVISELSPNPIAGAAIKQLTTAGGVVEKAFLVGAFGDIIAGQPQALGHPNGRVDHERGGPIGDESVE
jgi:hypothetical protein